MMNLATGGSLTFGRRADQAKRPPPRLARRRADQAKRPPCAFGSARLPQDAVAPRAVAFDRVGGRRFDLRQPSRPGMRDLAIYELVAGT